VRLSAANRIDAAAIIATPAHATRKIFMVGSSSLREYPAFLIVWDCSTTNGGLDMFRARQELT
jgi:hypothetical protein